MVTWGYRSIKLLHAAASRAAGAEGDLHKGRCRRSRVHIGCKAGPIWLRGLTQCDLVHGEQWLISRDSNSALAKEPIMAV